MKVRNTGSKMYILGDAIGVENGTRLLPGKEVDSADMSKGRKERFELCVKRGVAKGKPFVVTEGKAKKAKAKKVESTYVPTAGDDAVGGGD